MGKTVVVADAGEIARLKKAVEANPDDAAAHKPILRP